MTETDVAEKGRAGGIALALTAAVGLGTAIALARIAHDSGTTALSIATIRTVFVVLLMYLICKAAGRNLAVSWPQWLHCCGLGLLAGQMFYGNVGAVKFIPVGLAALVFFTYPPMVAVMMAVLNRRMPGLVKSAALIGAFSGLWLMLGVSLDTLDWRGVALSLSAAVACAANAVWIQQKMMHVDVLVLTFHMSLVAGVVFVVATLATGGIVAPTTGAGWMAMLGIMVLQGCAVPLYFAAIPRIGAETSAMVTNLQPVTSIAAAYLLFAETLSPLQFTGGAMVLGSIILMQAHDARTRRRMAQAAGLS